MLPTVSVVLVSGIAAVAVGIASVSAAVYVVLPGRVLLFLYEKLCELAAGIPFCTWIAGSPELWQCAGYYVLLFLGVEILGMSRELSHGMAQLEKGREIMHSCRKERIMGKEKDG